MMNAIVAMSVVTFVTVGIIFLLARALTDILIDLYD
jgi:hypothetical protein